MHFEHFFDICTRFGVIFLAAATKLLLFFNILISYAVVVVAFELFILSTFYKSNNTHIFICSKYGILMNFYDIR